MSPMAWGRPGTWLRLAGLVAVYYAAARIGLLFALSDSVASPIWPPAGLAVAAGVLWGRRALPAVFVGAFLVEVSAGVPLHWSALMALGNMAEAGAAAWLMARAGGVAAFQSVNGVLRLGLAAAVGPIIAASTGMAGLLGSGMVPASGALAVWWTWYLGDVAGIVIFAPAVLLVAHAVSQASWRRLTNAMAVEATAAFALLALAMSVVFGLVAIPISFFAIGPLMWIAIRLGPTSVALSLVGMDAIAVAATANARGPFAAASPNAAFLLLQAYMLSISLVCLLIATVAVERRRVRIAMEANISERTTTLELVNQRLQAEVEERRRAEESVLEAQRIAGMGSWKWDVAANRVDWSAELCRIFGVEPDGFHGDYATYLSFVHPDDRSRIDGIVQEAFKQKISYAMDHRILRRDGSVRYIRSQGRVETGRHGQVVSLTGIAQDVTERVQADRLQEREREAHLEVRRLQEQADFKTNFLRTAAHELGTPLTPIRIQISILRRMLTGEDQEKAFVILERNLDRLNMLVKDLLESARLQSGRLKLSPRPMDLAAAVHEVAETFQEPAIRAGIALDTRGIPVLPIVADPDRITQVLYNLLSNAVKFTPSGGSVTLEAELIQESVRITVRDSGPGFTVAQAERLFQPFSQLHDAMQRTRAGSGLGLYICKGIVEQHGGTIAAHSDGPGKGATFTVILPREAVVQPMLPMSEPVVPRSGLGMRSPM